MVFLICVFSLYSRDSFPFDQQFNILMRFIVDQTQTPNLKVSIGFAILFRDDLEVEEQNEDNTLLERSGEYVIFPGFYLKGW